MATAQPPERPRRGTVLVWDDDGWTLVGEEDEVVDRPVVRLSPAFEVSRLGTTVDYDDDGSVMIVGDEGADDLTSGGVIAVIPPMSDEGDSPPFDESTVRKPRSG